MSHCARFWRAELIAAGWHCVQPVQKQLRGEWWCSSGLGSQKSAMVDSLTGTGARAIPDAEATLKAAGTGVATAEHTGARRRLSCTWATGAAVRPDRDIADAILEVWYVKGRQDAAAASLLGEHVAFDVIVTFPCVDVRSCV
jgi:hypothetical protein